MRTDGMRGEEWSGAYGGGVFQSNAIWRGEKLDRVGDCTICSTQQQRAACKEGGGLIQLVCHDKRNDD